MLARSTALLCCVLTFPAAAAAAEKDYKVEALEEPPPDALSEAIRDALNPSGLRILQPGGEVLCDLWLAKAADAKPGFKPSSSVKYPFVLGALVGALRFGESGGHDFREQMIPGGIYTLRYVQQPVDGDHLGTSPFQDFLALVPAGSDKNIAALADFELEEASKQSAEGGTHPGILSLQPPGPKPPASAQVQKKGDYWVLSTQLGGKAKEESLQIGLNLVVVGHAIE